MKLSKRGLNTAAYVVFIALILAAPLVFDVFWLNRLSKYLVFGMLGAAIALSWGYAGILNLSARACSSAWEPMRSPCR